MEGGLAKCRRGDGNFDLAADLAIPDVPTTAVHTFTFIVTAPTQESHIHIAPP